MAEEIRVWQIQNGELNEIPQSKLNLEQRLENWLEKDISVLSDELLVIGRQVKTDFGGKIDLLCLAQSGDLVIVELKRDRTPREVTAQILDYGSWVKNLSSVQITGLADAYLEQVSLEVAYRERFGEDLPDVLNENHSMILVAAEMDTATERIINYLSDSYGVSINAATFQYHADNHVGELLARVFLIEPEQVEYRTQKRSTSKRNPNLTYEQLREIAAEKQVETQYKLLVDELSQYFSRGRTRSSLTLKASFDGSRRVVFSVIPTDSSGQEGLKFQVYIYRLADALDVKVDDLLDFLPDNRREWSYGGSEENEWTGYEGFFRTMDEVQRFLKGVHQHVP